MLRRTSCLIKAIRKDLIPFQRSVNYLHLFLNTAQPNTRGCKGMPPHSSSTGACISGNKGAFQCVERTALPATALGCPSEEGNAAVSWFSTQIKDELTISEEIVLLVFILEYD